MDWAPSKHQTFTHHQTQFSWLLLWKFRLDPCLDISCLYHLQSFPWVFYSHNLVYLSCLRLSCPKQASNLCRTQWWKRGRKALQEQEKATDCHSQSVWVKFQLRQYCVYSKTWGICHPRVHLTWHHWNNHQHSSRCNSSIIVFKSRTLQISKCQVLWISIRLRSSTQGRHIHCHQRRIRFSQRLHFCLFQGPSRALTPKYVWAASLELAQYRCSNKSLRRCKLSLPCSKHSARTIRSQAHLLLLEMDWVQLPFCTFLKGVLMSRRQACQSYRTLLPVLGWSTQFGSLKFDSFDRQLFQTSSWHTWRLWRQT